MWVHGNGGGDDPGGKSPDNPDDLFPVATRTIHIPEGREVGHMWVNGNGGGG
ncbi:hypothetical protein GCM10010094_62560 [Streptomyces flaveus]|uniref:Uncharacterized protein n=1 Tax=Streptomyces flaveus TaxID=66370 RepID=A0A917R744_9ACTN|nr:hypothetical protein GCM10010094_62560 [Streptomyces flaveus]